MAGNRIGTDPTGTSAVANNIGVSFHAPDSTIGATAPSTPGLCSGDCNVISGNTTAGVSTADVDLPMPLRSKIVGNVVGTDPTGHLAIASASYASGMAGINVATNFVDQGPLSQADSIMVGGPTAIPGTAPGNLVSGNIKGIVGGDSNCNPSPCGRPYDMIAQGNLIGATWDGSTALGNATGISDIFSDGDVIGGPSSDDAERRGRQHLRAVISGGLVEGNRIGIGLDGTVIKNTLGVDGEGSTVCGNTVSGNATGLSGLVLLSSGNRIGTDPSGTSAVPNLVGISGQGISSVQDSRCPDLGPDLVSGNTQAGISTGSDRDRQPQPRPSVCGN